jgi:hypothetical protein
VAVRRDGWRVRVRFVPAWVRRRRCAAIDGCDDPLAAALHHAWRRLRPYRHAEHKANTSLRVRRVCRPYASASGGARGGNAYDSLAAFHGGYSASPFAFRRRCFAVRPPAGCTRASASAPELGRWARGGRPLAPGVEPLCQCAGAPRHGRAHRCARGRAAGGSADTSARRHHTAGGGEGARRL